MSDIKLLSLTAMGQPSPVEVVIGGVTIAENPGLALASLAIRKNGAAAVMAAATQLKLAMSAPGTFTTGSPYGALWLGPEQWMIMADFANHELLAAELETAFGKAASITEQTDGWVCFDLSGADLAKMMERLCALDIRAMPSGSGTRTVIEHMGCYVMLRDGGRVRILGARSSAASLLHALEAAALSVT